MDTFKIKQTLYKISKAYQANYNRKLFYRVCASDLLPRKIPLNQEVVVIVNTDTSGKVVCKCF